MLKHLRNVAHNIAHKFSVSSSYFARISLINDFVDVEIELTSGKIIPLLFDIDRNNTLVAYCKENFYELLTENENQQLKSAILKGHFYRIEEDLFGDFIVEIILNSDEKLIGKIVTHKYSRYLLETS